MSTTSEETVYAAFEVHEELEMPTYKRLKLRSLDFIRNNYLRLILTMFFIIVFLISIILIVTFVLVKINQVSNQEVEDNLNQRIEQILKNNLSNANNNSNPQEARGERSKSLRESQELRSNSIPEQLMKRTFCQRMRCEKEIHCFPSDVLFASLRAYTCCCLPDWLAYKYYENDEYEDYVRVVFQHTKLDPASMSTLDLRLLPKLENLKGTWHRLQTGEKIYLLSYDRIAIPVKPDEFLQE